MVKDGALNIDFTDEIIDAAAVTDNGAKRTSGSAGAAATKDGK